MKENHYFAIVIIGFFVFIYSFCLGSGSGKQMNLWESDATKHLYSFSDLKLDDWLKLELAVMQKIYGKCESLKIWEEERWCCFLLGQAQRICCIENIYIEKYFLIYFLKIP